MEIFNHDEGRQAIKSELKGLHFIKVSKQKSGLIVGLLTLLIGIIFLLWGLIDFSHLDEGSASVINGKTIGGALASALGGALTIYFQVYIGKATKANIQKLVKYNYHLHELYFSKARQPQYDYLKINGYENSDLFGNVAMVFDCNGYVVKWHVAEDVEIRTKTIVDSKGRTKTVTYKVYILKSCLENYLPQLTDLKPITISEGNATKALARDRYWQSESIEFNERYKVEGEDEFQIVKLFTPKIITNFNESPHSFNGRKISLRSGLAYINWRSNSEKLKSNHPNFLDWSGLLWNNNCLDEIADKIQKDLTLFADNQILLEHFEFTKVPLPQAQNE